MTPDLVTPARNGNRTVYLIGAVVVGLSALFTLLNGIPWPSRSELEAMRRHTEAQMSAIHEQHDTLMARLDDLRNDVREIRAVLLPARRMRDP